MDNLLNCPFCGGDNIEEFYEDIEDDNQSENAYILCHDCWFESGIYFRRKIIRDMWNRRAPLNHDEVNNGRD